MKLFLEKENKRYAIATLDMPTQYLISQNGENLFTNDISRCTKTISRDIANFIVNDFYRHTSLTDLELVVVPVKISYELINEYDER